MDNDKARFGEIAIKVLEFDRIQTGISIDASFGKRAARLAQVTGIDRGELIEFEHWMALRVLARVKASAVASDVAAKRAEGDNAAKRANGESASKAPSPDEDCDGGYH